VMVFAAPIADCMDTATFFHTIGVAI